MSGYNGYSKSNNAVDAEIDGRYPMTHAKRIVAEECGITQKLASIILKACWDGEYHHTSKHYNSTDYYNTELAIAVYRLAISNGWTADEIASLPEESVLSSYEADDQDDLTEELIDLHMECTEQAKANSLLCKMKKAGIKYVLFHDHNDNQWTVWMSLPAKANRHQVSAFERTIDLYEKNNTEYAAAIKRFENKCKQRQQQSANA
jgi:hypothetical protein